MQCQVCRQGSTERSTTTITLERENTTLIFKHVPADVCSNCGEAYVDAETTANLLKIAEQEIQKGVQVDIREYAALFA